MLYSFIFPVILLYDYLLTIDLEVERVWRRALKVPSALFYLVSTQPEFSFTCIQTKALIPESILSIAFVCLDHRWSASAAL